MFDQEFNESNDDNLNEVDSVGSLLFDELDGQQPNTPASSERQTNSKDMDEESPKLEDVADVPEVKFDRLNKRLIDGAYSLISGEKVPRPFAPFEDPRQKIQEAKDALRGNFRNEDHASFQKAIKDGDALDKVWIAERFISNRNVVELLPHAVAYLQLDKRRTYLADLAKGATNSQREALGKMWAEVATIGSTVEDGKSFPALTTWLAKPENDARRRELEGLPYWNELKTGFREFVVKNQEASKFKQLNELDLQKNPGLRRDIKKVVEAIKENKELAELYLSPITTRSEYLDKLLEQDDVKKYMTLSEDDKAKSSLKKSPAVVAAIETTKQLFTCFVKPDKEVHSKLFDAAAKLGVSVPSDGNKKK